MKNSDKFFANKDCPFFPCHPVEDSEKFNCLFCYCPLYNKIDCGGVFSMIDLPNGKKLKICSECNFPHIPENHDKIISKIK